jgi:subtilisin family serine protease
LQPVFRTESRAAYHEGMLVVRVRQTTPAAGLAVAAAAASFVPQTAGLAALSFYERAGMIKRIVPLSRAGAEVSRRPGLSAVSSLLAAAAPYSVAGALPAGAGKKADDRASIVELEREQDAQALQVALAQDPNIESVSRVPVRYLLARRARKKKSPAATAGLAPAAVPPPASTMWNLRKIRWEQARMLATFKSAASVRVAVLDSGIDTGHPDLAGRIQLYVSEHPDLPKASSQQDLIGHGTHVAGTIAALVNNLGINGICDCQLHIWKIFDDEPDFDPFAREYVYYVNPIMYRRALADCVEAGVEVVNLSIGGPGAPDIQEKLLFDQLIANGTVVCAAMGNERQFGSPTSFPAAIPGVIAVGATNLDDTVTSFSNRGNHIAISAPGQAIWSTLPTYPGQTGFTAEFDGVGRPRQGKPIRREQNYDAWPGTSMATPHVAAAVALHISSKGKKPPAAVRQALADTADKVPAMGGQSFHPDFGGGRLNLEKLLS